MQNSLLIPATTVKSAATAFSRSAAPTILLTATLRWPIAARLAMAFAELGCRVEVLCPPQHPAIRTRAVRAIHAQSIWKPLNSLHNAINAASPDLIIPCDDDAALHLHRLYEKGIELGPAANAIRLLIARSLGTPESSTLATTRGEFMALARKEGLRVPATSVVTSLESLDAWLAQNKFPAVLKKDCTWGGLGVAIVHDRDEARHAFVRMSSRVSLAIATARFLRDRDLLQFLKARASPRTVTIQSFVAGVPANRAVSCWQGQTLAGISVQALKTQHATGPASVVRVIDNREMTEAAKKLVHTLGLSGFWGFDFILDRGTNEAHLIEMNPRATPICHFAVGSEQNLVHALYAQLSGVSSKPRPRATDSNVVALFPGEMQRDAASSYLRSAYHDVPWSEPDLIRECIDRPWPPRGAISRLLTQLGPKKRRRRWPDSALVETE